MTRGRERYEADDREAEAIVWLQQLSKYPADIALDVIRNWPNRSDGQWWPTWHDVHKELEGQTNARRLLAAHIRSGACLVKPSTDLDRDDSPEGIAHRKAVVERAMQRFPAKEAEPIDHVEDYDAWEARKKAEIEADRRSGKFTLSPEALGTVSDLLPPKQTRAA